VEKTLRAGLNHVAFAAATDETRPVLSGVLPTVQGDELTLAAADGFRLAVSTVPLAEPMPESALPNTGAERFVPCAIRGSPISYRNGKESQNRLPCRSPSSLAAHGSSRVR